MNIREMFDYDLWAQKRWVPVADAMGENHVLAHMLVSSQVWLARCRHVETDLRDDLPLVIRMEENHAAWQAFLEIADVSEQVFYTNSRGESYTNTVEEIAQHVINHGTYHRGQLRGIAQEKRVDFPETDLIAFLREG